MYIKYICSHYGIPRVPLRSPHAMLRSARRNDRLSAVRRHDCSSPCVRTCMFVLRFGRDSYSFVSLVHIHSLGSARRLGSAEFSSAQISCVISFDSDCHLRRYSLYSLDRLILHLSLDPVHDLDIKMARVIQKTTASQELVHSFTFTYL